MERKLHSEELHDLCFSTDVIRAMKSGRMRWAGNVERIGYKKTDVHRIFWGENLGKMKTSG
jgi:hypothetical protein